MCIKFFVFVCFLTHFGLITARTECGPGTFRKRENCISCPAGTFQNMWDKPSCSPCPGGTHRKSSGASSIAQCIRCPRSFYSSAGSSTCRKCQSGHFSLAGSDQCGKCGAGFELKAIGGPCQPCKPGFFSEAERHGNRMCSRCPDGTFSSKGASLCTPCPRGSFRRNTPTVHGRQDIEEDGSLCSLCEEGTYSDATGSFVCKLCPPGTFSRKGASSCSPCPRGQYSFLVGSSGCTRCPRGSTSLGLRPAGCKHKNTGCSPETFENASGECEACMPGFFFFKKKGKCLPCPGSRVSRGGLQSKCGKCPKGKVPLGDHSIFENSGCECAPGTMDDGNGGCIPCPPGFYWSRPSYNKVLLLNLARARALQPGSCHPCPKGYFNSKSRRLECDLCLFNTFQDEIGSTECKECPGDSRSPIGITDPKLLLPSRTLCEVDETGCAPGEVRDAVGSCSARSCPLPGTFFKGSKCTRCANGSIYVRKKGDCEKCDTGGASSGMFTSNGGLSTECKKCPVNTHRSIFVPRICMCRTLSYSGLSYGLLNGNCVVCPRGFGNVLPSSIDSFCGKCPPGSMSASTGDSVCTPCGPNSTTRGEDRTKCIQCPAGTRRPRDVFGLLLNECRRGD